MDVGIVHTLLLHIRQARFLTPDTKQIIYHHGGFLSIFLRFTRCCGIKLLMLCRFWRVERWYRIKRRAWIGSLAVSAGPRTEVVFSGSLVVELTGRRHCVLGLVPLIPLEVEALARQVRREAVGWGSGRRQLSPHCMSHSRHVRPRERTAWEQHVPYESLYGSLAD